MEATNAWLDTPKAWLESPFILAEGLKDCRTEGLVGGP